MKTYLEPFREPNNGDDSNIVDYTQCGPFLKNTTLPK